MTIKIKQFNKTYCIRIKSLNEAIKALKKQNLNPQVSYEYWDQLDTLPTFYQSVLCVNISFDYGMSQTWTLHFPVHWKVNGKPVVETTTTDTKIILDSIIKGGE